MEPDRAPVPQARINEMIRAPKVRLVDDDGSQIGVKDTNEAREYAWAKNLDLVEVAAQADPPVAKVMDYGKYRYEQEQKAKLALRAGSTESDGRGSRAAACSGLVVEKEESRAW